MKEVRIMLNGGRANLAPPSFDLVSNEKIKFIVNKEIDTTQMVLMIDNMEHDFSGNELEITSEFLINCNSLKLEERNGSNQVLKQWKIGNFICNLCNGIGVFLDEANFYKNKTALFENQVADMQNEIKALKEFNEKVIENSKATSEAINTILKDIETLKEEQGI